MVVEAVLVSRYAGPPCPKCENALYGVAPEIELGTVFTVDLDSRKVVTRRNGSHGVHFDLEMVNVVGTAQWLPVEVLRTKGMPI